MSWNSLVCLVCVCLGAARIYVVTFLAPLNRKITAFHHDDLVLSVLLVADYGVLKDCSLNLLLSYQCQLPLTIIHATSTYSAVSANQKV